ncbi:hypothetical protein K8R33_00480 [archaeon]|nr:hypothetical protein [archaeon]
MVKEIIKELNKEAGIKGDKLKKLKSKKPFGRLGQGVHNGVFYHGTSLDDTSATITSNKEIYLGITEYVYSCKDCGAETKTISKKINEKPKIPKKCSKCNKSNWTLIKKHNEIINDFGLNYRTDFNDEAIDYFWDTNEIKGYLEGNYKQKELKDIYQDIVKINKKYIEHLNEETHKFIACWIMGTYVYTIFEQYGRLYFRAERGSGKTQQSRIVKFLSFNPMWITKGSESSIFRDGEATCGTFIIDNMDKLNEELKRAIEHYIETGWMWDATYRLTNKDTHQTQKFQSYTPMNLNNILGLDEDTVDKTFEILMLKSVNDDIKRKKPTPKSEDWKGIRNDIRCWALDNWKKVEEAYQETTADFSGREFDVVEGPLTIAKLLGQELYDELCEYIKQKIEEQTPDLENNPSYIIFT